MIDKPRDNVTCPATMHAEKCIDHFMNCPKWINVTGKHPQSDEVVNQWDCADTWVPILLIENSQQQRQTGSAIESFRNEMVRGQEKSEKLLSRSVELIGGQNDNLQ